MSLMRREDTRLPLPLPLFPLLPLPPLFQRFISRLLRRHRRLQRQ